MFLMIYKLNSLLNMLQVFLSSSIWEGDGQGIMGFCSRATPAKRIFQKSKPWGFLFRFRWRLLAVKGLLKVKNLLRQFQWHHLISEALLCLWGWGGGVRGGGAGVSLSGLRWPTSEGSVPSLPWSIVSGFAGQEALTDTFSIVSLPV